MASTSSSSVLHGEAPEASDMEFQEHQLVVRMPHSVTTVASSSSSRSELHRTFNQSEEQQIFRMGSEEQQTLDTEFHGQRDVSMASNDHEQTSVVSSSEIHRPIDGNSKGQQILDIELEGKRDFDTGTEARQVYSKESEQHNALDTRSEEVYEATDIPQPSLFLAKDEDGGVSSQPVGEKQDEYVTGIRLVLVLAAITIVYFLIMLDNTIIATAIPYITDEFHSLLDVGWYGSAYQLSSCALQPLGGKVYSKLNSKWAFITYLILFEVGSVICGTASSSTMLIVGRGVAGIGGSGLLNGALIILNSSVPPHRQPGLVGIMMGIGQLGIAFGPLIGGAFTEWVTWRWCFYLNLPIGAIIALTVLFIRIPDHIVKPSIREVFKHAIMDFDLPGFVLFAPAAIMLFLALQYGGNQFAWNSIEVIGLFCGAGVTFVVWLVWDWYQGDNAMVPFSMMRKRIVWVSCVAGLFLSGTVFVTAYYLPIYFQAVHGFSPFTSGVDILPNLLSQMVFGITAGVLIQRIGYFTPLLLAGSALNAVGCGLLSLLTPNTPTGYWIGFQIIMGTGRGLAMAVPFLAIQNSLEKDMIPAAMSTLVFLQNFSAAVMVVFAQTILTNSLVSLVPQNAPGVDPQLVISVGTTSGALERVVGAAQLPGVLWAYSKSLQRIWYFAGCLGIPPFLVGWCLGWVNIRKKAKDTELDRSVETLEA